MLAKPATELEVPHPAEIGFYPRAPWEEKKEIEGVFLSSARLPVLIPGGIVSRGNILHTESFPDRSKYSTTRYIKKKNDGHADYFTLPSWGDSLIGARIREGFFLDGDYVDHYGHFITEALPRLWAALEYSRLRQVPVITSTGNISLIRFFLDALNLSSMAVEPIRQPTQVERLWLASSSYKLGRGFNLEARRVFGTISKAFWDNRSREKVYLSRRGLDTKTSRRLLNEVEVERVFMDAGFRVIAPQEMSLAEQLGIFANSRILAGPTGTTMYNRVFQRPRGRALLLGAHSYMLPDHAYLSSLMGQEPALALNGQALGADPQSADWVVDISALKKAVALLTE